MSESGAPDSRSSGPILPIYRSNPPSQTDHAVVTAPGAPATATTTPAHVTYAGDGSTTPTRSTAQQDPPTPSSARRHNQSISVSLRPRSDSTASNRQSLPRAIRASFAGSRDGKDGPDDEEAILTGDGDVKRKRRSSVVDRLRGSVSSGGPRERSGSGPVAYEMVPSPKGKKGDDDRDEENRELGDEVVGMLDVIDPEVSTVNHLQNVTNGIFLPHFPALWSRRPEIKLGNEDSGRSSKQEDGEEYLDTSDSATRKRASTVASLFPSAPSSTRRPSFPRSTMRSDSSVPHTASRLNSQLNSPAETPGLYPPKAAELHTTASRDSLASVHSLDAHVRQVLHETKRQKIVKGLKGLWVFLKTPMGFATGIYGILVVFWGAAIVFFLLNWIPTPSKYWQDRWVEISSQIVNALFTITGVGLIPWRAQDTYRMSIIWTLRQKTHRLRKKQGLPPIEDPNDIEDPKDQEEYVSVLTEKERARLKYQQEMFAKSQTWYRPHATSTHRAFPMSWALWNTILIDLNSAFQCILCGCMWGLNQYQRPAWTTGSLIPLGFLSGIGAGVLIWQGSARTKKQISVTEKLRQALGVPLAIGVPLSSNDQLSKLTTAKKGQAGNGSAGGLAPALPSVVTREKQTILEEREDEPDRVRAEAGAARTDRVERGVS